MCKEKLLEILDVALLNEEAVSSKPAAVCSASSVHVATPMPGAELRDARLAFVDASLLRVLHAAEHDGVERGGRAEEEVALGLAERAQRAKSKCLFQILHTVERLGLRRELVGRGEREVTHEIDRVRQILSRSDGYAPRHERLATALGPDGLIHPGVLKALLGEESVPLARHVVLAENVFDHTDKLRVFHDSARVERVVPDHDLAHGVVLQLHIVVSVCVRRRGEGFNKV